MSKIPSRKVNCSDCLVVREGKECMLHVDEWIEVIEGGTIRQQLAMYDLRKEAAGENPDPDKMAQSLAQICQEVSIRVMAWNWTDLNGEPLPQPYRNPDVIASLRNEELAYLIKAVAGEAPGERKNA